MPESRIQNDIARQQLLNAFLNPQLDTRGAAGLGQGEEGNTKSKRKNGIIAELTNRQMRELLNK